MIHEAREKITPPAIFLVVLMAAAVLLRLYRLGFESLWWDEYTSHVYLDAPSLLEFLWLNRTLDPLTFPLYYVFEYLWTHYIHDSVYGLRLMGIGVGVATIPLAYALGKRIYGPWAACVAAMMLALSFTHIHHSQSIRMYALLVFLAAVVAWSFIRVLEDSRPRDWLLHFAASFLMYWSHPLAGLVPAVLGAYLLLTLRIHYRVFFRWVIPQVVLYAPAATYLSLVRFWPEDSTGEWIARPSCAALVTDIFFDDISAFQWQFRLGAVAERLGAVRYATDVMFAATILILLAFLVFATVKNQLARGRVGGTAPSGPARSERLAIACDSRESSNRGEGFTPLLVIWLVLPPLMLFLVSWAWRPCMFPRYTVHCSLALYLMLGGAVHYLGCRQWRLLAVGLLAFFMALQWIWVQPGPQRTDWRSAAQLIHDSAGPQDLIQVENMLWRDVFVHNAKHLTSGVPSVPVAAARGMDLLAAQNALVLGMASADASLRGRNGFPAVWTVIALDFFEPGPPVAFEQALTGWGLGAYQRWFFPSVREIYVYRTQAPESNSLPGDVRDLLSRWETDATQAPDLDHHAMQAFGDLATVLAEHGNTEQAESILNTLQASNAFASKVYGNLTRTIMTGGDILEAARAIQDLWTGYGYRQNNQPRHAIAAFRTAVEHDSDHALAHLELGIELAGTVGGAAAINALVRAGELDNEYEPMLKNLIVALGRDAMPDAVLAATLRYRDGLLALSGGKLEEAEQLLRQALAHDPSLYPAQATLGYVLMLQERLDEAYAVLLQCVEMTDHPDPQAYGNLAILTLVSGHPEKAREYVRRALETDVGFARRFGHFAQVLFEEQNYGEALRELRRLRDEGVHYPPFFERHIEERAALVLE